MNLLLINFRKSGRRTKAIKTGNPPDPTIMMGAQTTNSKKNPFLHQIRQEEGAGIALVENGIHLVPGDLEGGYSFQPFLKGQ